MKPRFKITSYGYKFDRYIFRVAILIMIIFFGIVAITNNFNFINIYTKCDIQPYCYNPFYQNSRCKYDWCNKEILPYGFEFGSKPNFLYKLVIPFCIVLFFGSFLINHYKYNKGMRLVKLEGL